VKKVVTSADLAISRETERRWEDWLRSYLTSILTRDLRDIAEVEKLTELPKFVRLRL